MAGSTFKGTIIKAPVFGILKFRIDAARAVYSGMPMANVSTAMPYQTKLTIEIYIARLIPYGILIYTPVFGINAILVERARRAPIAI